MADSKRKSFSGLRNQGSELRMGHKRYQLQPEQSIELINEMNDKAGNQIRMKILVENKRLKNSIEQLGEDIQQHRCNQIAIADIVKESKLKIINYKERLKQKSKKITQLTEANIELKQDIRKKQEKISQITTYSDWQENQIRQYKAQILLLRNDYEQSGRLKNKIQQLQLTIKENLRQLSQHSDNHQSDRSIGVVRNGSTNQLVLFSNNIISQNHQDRWMSVKEMSMEEVELMRQRQANDEEYERLAEINENLNNKIVDLQQIVQKVRAQMLLSQSKWQQYRLSSEQRERQLTRNLQQLCLKWKKSNSQLQEREKNIIDLSRQLQEAHDQVLKIEDQQNENYQKLQKTIIGLQEFIDRQQAAILEMKQKWYERQNSLKKELAQIINQLSSQQEKYIKDINQIIETNRILKEQIEAFQKKEEHYSFKLSELETYIQENEQKIREASGIINQKKHFQDMLEELHEENQILLEQIREKEMLEIKLNEAENYIQEIQYQIFSHDKDIEKRKEDIKGQINLISVSQQGSNRKTRSNRPRTMMIESLTDQLALKQIEPIDYGTTINNYISKFRTYEKLQTEKQKDQQNQIIKRTKSLEFQINNLRQNLLKQQSTNGQLSQKLQNYATVNKTIQQQRSSLRNTNNQLNTIINKLNSISTVENPDKITEKLFEITQERNQLQEAFISLTNQYEEIKVKTFLLQQEIAQLRLKLNRTDQGNNEISNIKASQIATIRIYENRVRQMETIIEQNKSQISTLKKQYNQKIREVIEYQHQLEQAQKDNYHQQQKLKQYYKTDGLIMSKEEELKQLRENSSKMKDQIQQMKANFENIEVQKDQWLSSSQKQQLYINEYQQQIEMLQVELKCLKGANFQLTQRNDQLNEIIKNLRRDVIFKSNKLFESHELIEKVNKNSQGNVKQKKQSSVNDVRLSKAFQQIKILKQSNFQLRQRQQALQAHLRAKVHDERQLRQKYQVLAGKDAQIFHKKVVSSNVGFPQQINLSNSQRNKKFQAQLESLRLKLQQAQAYIIQLKRQSQSQKSDDLNRYHPYNQINKNEDGQQQNESSNLKLKIEYLQAYVNHLESQTNLKSSNHSKNNIYPQGYRQQQKKCSEVDKIKALCDFVQNYSREVSSAEKERQVKRLLDNSNLSQLFNSIFYKFEKEAIAYRDHQNQISQLLQQKRILHEENQDQRQKCMFLQNRLLTFKDIEEKLEETEALFEQTLFQKMKNEEEIAEKKTYLRILEERVNKIQESMNAKEDQIGPLSVLQEENQSQNDSQESQKIDSKEPASDLQYNQFQTNLDRNRQQQFYKNYESSKGSKQIMHTQNENISLEGISIIFLKRFLEQIEEIEIQVSDIQQELQQTALLMSQKLQQIQQNIKMNDRQMQNHFNKCNFQLIALVKDILLYQQEQDKQGYKIQNRKKIQDYLRLLDQQQTKHRRLNQQKQIKLPNNKLSPSIFKNNLSQIKEDINEQNGSSIINPLRQPFSQNFNSKTININQRTKNKAEDNPVEALIKLQKGQFLQFSINFGNKQLQAIKCLIQQVLEERIEDCLNYLKEEKSLFADILQIEEQEKLSKLIHQLAHQKSRQELTYLLNNYSNQIVKQNLQLSHLSDQYIFEPNGPQIQEIYNRIFPEPTQLSLSLYNQLLAILGSPNKLNLYESLEEFYKLVKHYELNGHNQISFSQKHSLKMKQLLQGSLQNINIKNFQGIDILNFKNQNYQLLTANFNDLRP